MSVSTGTATGVTDLLAKFIAFVTGAPGWQQVATQSANGPTPYVLSGNDVVEAEVYLKAPGLSGTEQIFLNLRAYQSLPDDRYNIECRGASGYLASSRFEFQPITSPPVYAYFWNQAMPYWFVANGQRAIVVVKVQNTYQSFYIGKILPYGTPSQYPYPVFIGGMGVAEAQRYSQADRNLSAFWDGNGSYIANVDGSWSDVSNWQPSNNEVSVGVNSSWPWIFSSLYRLQNMASNLDGTYTILPGRIENSSPVGNVLGEFDGVGFVTGYQNASESEVVFAGQTWLTVSNGFRSGLGDYAAILLA